MCTQNSGMIGHLPSMYPDSATTSPCNVSVTRNDILKKVIRVCAAGRTLWGEDHYVNPFFLFIVQTTGKKIGYGSIPEDLSALGFTADPSGDFPHRVAGHIVPPELDISSL